MRTTTAFLPGQEQSLLRLPLALAGRPLDFQHRQSHAPKQGAVLSKVERRTTDPIPASNPLPNFRPTSRRHKRRQPSPSPSAPRRRPPRKKPSNSKRSRNKPSRNKPSHNRLCHHSSKRNRPTLRRLPCPRRPRSQLIGNPRAMRTPLRPFPTRSLPRLRRKPLRASHLQLLTMRSPGRAMLTSNASCAVPRRSARPNAACNGWRSAATAVAAMTSCAMSSRRSGKKPTRRAFSRPSR